MQQLCQRILQAFPTTSQSAACNFRKSKRLALVDEALPVSFWLVVEFIVKMFLSCSGCRIASNIKTDWAPFFGLAEVTF
jgi:hypothetical protein